MDPPSGKTYVVDPGVFGSETPILESLEHGPRSVSKGKNSEQFQKCIQKTPRGQSEKRLGIETKTSQ
jgi:hypothetical protein